ncbi:MAG: 3-hydroxymyristoyl-ACP dehydratase [Rickettsiales bacterium]|jgi:predicted hotdog family 3-hydroxylacyl-ACP dehydratase|nr:3-hydroxymyristoyl-ACP dehydratase [Rickettsiales bacterium]
MRLSRQNIESRIPHKGTMCLLEEVLHWDETSIRCHAINLTDPAHPLRHNGVLSSVCGIEYGAQAMAIHGSLLDNKAQKEGYLVALRNVLLHVPRLDVRSDTLDIEATKLHHGDESSLYRFVLTSGEKIVVEGQATVMIRERA